MPAPILRFFRSDHLREGMGKDFSAACAALARSADETIPDNAEKSAGLRKLLEAKDCFVRAALPPEA